MLLTYQVWLFILKNVVLVFEREQQVKLASQKLSVSQKLSSRLYLNTLN